MANSLVRRCSYGRNDVFHGAGAQIVEPHIIIGRFTKDFGPGFYCTVMREQAVRQAKRQSTPVVNEYSVRIEPSLNVLEFKGTTNEWLDFIASCRRGIPHQLDIVIGPMADDQVFNIIADYLDGNITRDQFWALARFKYPTHQIAFCTERSLPCLRFSTSEEVAPW